MSTIESSNEEGFPARAGIDPVYPPISMTDDLVLGFPARAGIDPMDKSGRKLSGDQVSPHERG